MKKYIKSKKTILGKKLGEKNVVKKIAKNDMREWDSNPRARLGQRNLRAFGPSRLPHLITHCSRKYILIK